MPSIESLRHSVSRMLIIAAKQWRKQSNEALSGYRVSEACAAPLLIATHLGEAVRQVTLAELTGIEGPSLTRLLDQLCRAGLMIRTDDPSDGRAKTVTVTGEGHAVSENIEQTIAVLRADVLGDLVKEDLEATCRVLKAFIGKDGAVEAYEVEGDSQRSD